MESDMTRARGVLITAVALLAVACTAGTVEDQRGLGEADLDESEGGLVITASQGPWTVFDNPYGDGSANPAQGVSGEALELAYTEWELTVVKLDVTGITADRQFGAHAHKLSCADNKGGGHYQNVVPPTGVSPNDPSVANPENEVWLDFVTDNEGSGGAVAWVAWFFRPGEARAVVIHDHATDIEGKAGAKLACIDVPF
jgi:hypothetical protein